MSVDPILTATGAVSLAVILASAASHKVRAPAWFRRQVADYRLLPEALHRPAARALPLLEGALALALLWPATRGTAALAALALVSLYAAAIGINLARGRRDLDCGCAGPGAPQPLHPRLLVRNLLLAGLALLAAAPALPRALGVFDGFVVLAATAVTVLLYAAIEVWLANQPRLLGLSGR